MEVEEWRDSDVTVAAAEFDVAVVVAAVAAMVEGKGWRSPLRQNGMRVGRFYSGLRGKALVVGAVVVVVDDVPDVPDVGCRR